jgi:tetratricopeptide (TPR) repeat protein
VDRCEKELAELMNLLGGHPLAMRVLLPFLERQSAAEVRRAVVGNLAGLKADGDEAHRQLYAMLRFVEQGLPEELRALLVPLAMHEGYVDADYLEAMAKHVKRGILRAEIDRLMRALCTAGLLRDLGQATFEMHPVLTGYLRTTPLRDTPDNEKDAWTRGFVHVIGSVADRLFRQELHEQRIPSLLHRANFRFALEKAEHLGLTHVSGALMQSLARFAQNDRDYSTAHRLLERLAQREEALGRQENVARSYHQLGLIAEEQRDFVAAERWYRKSLAISEKEGNEPDVAKTYHHLGRIAEEKHDLAMAEEFYYKSLTIIQKKKGNERYAAGTYHQLGNIAAERRDFSVAERWYRESLAINEKMGNERDAASDHHELGSIALEQGHWEVAERCYRKSLEFTETLGYEDLAAITYHQLGIAFQRQGNHVAAEQWYLKSLAIKEKMGDEHGAASTYQQLGRVALERHDFGAAEQWSHKSLAIKENMGNEHGAAITCNQLGALAIEQRRYVEAGGFFLKAYLTFARERDQHLMTQTASNFRATHHLAPAIEKAKLSAMWAEAGLGALSKPDEDNKVE